MNTYPRQKWSDHVRTLNFRQGEHIFVSGPTSAGKTTLIREPLDKRAYVLCLFTKLKDRTIQRDYAGFKRFDRWPKHGFKTDEKRVMIWPYPERTLRGTVAKQRDVMRQAIDNIAHEGGRCVMLDETIYMTDRGYLNLGSEIGMLHFYGRSAGISCVTLAQRPFNIPRIVLSSSTHAYFARNYDKDDAKRLSDLGSMNPAEVVYNMQTAITDRHDFIYLNPQGDAPARIVNTRK